MEPQSSLPHSQAPVTCPYTDPARSSPYLPPPHHTSCRSILILHSHLHVGLPSGLFPSGFPTLTLYTTLLSPMWATCLAHLILLDFITRTMLGEEYRSFSSSSGTATAVSSYSQILVSSLLCFFGIFPFYKPAYRYEFLIWINFIVSYTEYSEKQAKTWVRF